jgi:hypothetical protein
MPLNLPPDFLSRAEALLLPLMGTEDERADLLSSAFYALERKLIFQLRIEGTASEFCRRTIRKLLDYGTLTDGTSALARLLEVAREQRGTNFRPEYDALISILNNAYAAQLPPNPAEERERYRRYYLQFLQYRHRTFDVKGLSTTGTYNLDLEKVFVNLRIAPEAAPTGHPVPPKGYERGSPIWDFLNAPLLRNLVILGAPGCGKTTLLKFVTLTFTAPTSPPNLPAKLPILLFLRDHADTIADTSPPTLPECVLQTLHYMSDAEKPPIAWFESFLRNGECLIMLDGLDEVGDPVKRRKVVRWVEGQMAAYGRNRFLITSRPGGYRSNPIEGVTQLEVLPFNPEEIRRFVHNWYLANEIMASQKDDPGVRMLADEGAEDLLRRIGNNADIAELAVNPLLLTMIATVHRYSSSLPDTRVKLYAEMCDVFLGKRDEARGLLNDLTPAQKQVVLQPLAYRMMVNETREIGLKAIRQIIKPALQSVPAAKGMTVEAFVDDICNRSGIMIQRENDVYAFSHKTFQEYLAAACVKNKRLIDELKTYIKHEWWHETIRLYCALEDGTAIIEACLSDDKQSVLTLRLALECAQEAVTIAPATNAKLQQVIYDSLESPERERRQQASVALLAKRRRAMVRLTDDIYIDQQPITHAEYQLFLDEEPFHAPLHWERMTFASGQSHLPLVGLSGASAAAFCTWLTNREKGWRYRLPTREEFTFKRSAWIEADGKIVLASPKAVENPLTLDQAAVTRLAHSTVSPEQMEVNAAAVIAQVKLMMHIHTLARALALDLDHARALDLAIDLDYVLDLDHARAIDRVRALDRALDHALTFDLVLDRAFARALTFDLVLDCARDLKERLTAIYTKYMRWLSAKLSPKAAEDKPLYKYLLWQVGRVFTLSRFPVVADFEFDGVKPLLQPPTTLAEVREIVLKSLLEHAEQEPAAYDLNYTEWDKTADDLLHLYALLVMIEKRRAGELGWEPYEMLYIVKERRVD